MRGTDSSNSARQRLSCTSDLQDVGLPPSTLPPLPQKTHTGSEVHDAYLCFRAQASALTCPCPDQGSKSRAAAAEQMPWQHEDRHAAMHQGCVPGQLAAAGGSRWPVLTEGQEGQGGITEGMGGRAKSCKQHQQQLHYHHTTIPKCAIPTNDPTSACVLCCPVLCNVVCYSPALPQQGPTWCRRRWCLHLLQTLTPRQDGHAGATLAAAGAAQGQGALAAVHQVGCHLCVPRPPAVRLPAALLQLTGLARLGSNQQGFAEQTMYAGAAAVAAAGSGLQRAVTALWTGWPAHLHPGGAHHVDCGGSGSSSGSGSGGGSGDGISTHNSARTHTAIHHSTCTTATCTTATCRAERQKQANAHAAGRACAPEQHGAGVLWP